MKQIEKWKYPKGVTKLQKAHIDGYNLAVKLLQDTREEALEEAYLEVAKYLTIRDEFGKMLKGEEILKKMKEL